MSLEQAGVWLSPATLADGFDGLAMRRSALASVLFGSEQVMPNPIQNTNNIYHGTTVPVDGQDFRNCVFQNCRILYSGGAMPSIVGCNFSNCQFDFDGAARRTLVYLYNIYHGLGEHGKTHIEAIFNAIRQPPQPASPSTQPPDGGPSP